MAKSAKVIYEGVHIFSLQQKGESQNGCYKKAKHAKFSEKQTFLTPWYVNIRVHIRGTKYSFFGKFGVLCFLETSVLRFALFPYYRQYFVRNVLHNAFVFKMALLWRFSWINFFAEPKKKRMDRMILLVFFISNSIFCLSDSLSIGDVNFGLKIAKKLLTRLLSQSKLLRSW